MAKQKSIDYILGMITGASIMIATWACTSGNPLNATGSTIQEVKVINQSWEPVYVDVVN
ncbi:MAG: ABC transporter ATP-binding protein [Candidatus Marinimicrobia bacterium]|nr:ABC transporter ATP-binding protein [Candidatus Neomarinimicrobiota bacterium]